MINIIAADLSLDKEAFDTVAKVLKDSLKKILVPNGRQFINPTFKEKPDYAVSAKEIELEEEDYPYVSYRMCADYNLYNVSGLYEEFASIISETRQSSIQVNNSPLMSCPTYTKFTTLLGTEVEKILGSTSKFIKNKWRSHVLVDMDFDNEDGSFNQLLKINISVFVK